MFWQPFSHPKHLGNKGAPPLASCWVSTPPSAGPVKILVEEAGDWAGKLSNPRQVSCWGRRLLGFVLLESIVSHRPTAEVPVAECREGRVQTESRCFSWGRKGSLGKGGKRLRERKGVIPLLPVQTSITHSER